MREKFIYDLQETLSNAGGEHPTDEQRHVLKGILKRYKKIHEERDPSSNKDKTARKGEKEQENLN